MSPYRIFLRVVCTVCELAIGLVLAYGVFYLPARIGGVRLSPMLIGAFYVIGMPFGCLYMGSIFGIFSDEKDVLKTGLQAAAYGLLVGAGVFFVGCYGLAFLKQAAVTKPLWLAAAVLPLAALVALEARLTYSGKQRCKALLAAVSRRLMEEHRWTEARYGEYQGGWSIYPPRPYLACWFKTLGDDCSVWRLTTGGRDKEADWKQFDLSVGDEKAAETIAAAIATLFPLASRGLDRDVRARIEDSEEPEIDGQTGEIRYFEDHAPAYPAGLPELVGLVELDNGDRWEIEAEKLYPLTNPPNT
jgi:hypothetical protein